MKLAHRFPEVSITQRQQLPDALRNCYNCGKPYTAETLLQNCDAIPSVPANNEAYLQAYNQNTTETKQDENV